MNIRSQMSLIMGQVIPDKSEKNWTSMVCLVFIFIINQYCLVLRWVIYDHHGPLVSSTGHGPASLCHGLLSSVCACVRPSGRPSVCALTFSWNIFFSETTDQILMKFHRNVPAIVFFRISWKNLIPSKTLVGIATKLKKMKSLKILSEAIGPWATKFGM